MDKQIIFKIQRAITNDTELVEDFISYDQMDNCEWLLPDGFKEHDWIRKRVSTFASDALKKSANIFDTHQPKITVIPLGPDDIDFAEEKELFASWMLQRANSQGATEPNRTMLKHDVKYDRICVQQNYLPYYLPKDKKKWTKQQRMAVASSPFVHTVFLPHNVKFEYGSYGLEWVAVVAIIAADELVNHWGNYANDGTDEGKKLSAALKEIHSEYIEDAEEKCSMLFVDYTGWDSKHEKVERVVFCRETGSETVQATDVSEEDNIVLIDAESKIGFINWAIGEGSSGPLLQPLLKGGLWENQCFLDTMRDSSVIKRGWYPLGVHESTDGKPMLQDFTGVDATIELKKGLESFQQIIPPPIDPGVAQLDQANSEAMAQAVGVVGIGAMQAANTQYATVNALIQLRLSELEPYKRTYEKVYAELARMLFKWIKATDDTLIAYRAEAKSETQRRGANITMSSKKFDEENLFIMCDLQPNNPTDKLQRVNMAAQIKQAGLRIPDEEIIESLGFGNVKPLMRKYEQQEIEMAALEAFKTRIMGEAQAYVQTLIAQGQAQIQMGMQQEQQAMMQQQGPPGGEQPAEGMTQGFPEGAGNAPPMGGSSPYESNPAMTQTQIAGPNGQPTGA
jgi:hypothetical protein